MHYEMTVETPGPMSTEQACGVLDALGDRYDSATIRAKRIEFDGSVRQLVDVAHIMLRVRHALGWPDGLRFTVEHDPTDRLGNPLKNPETTT